MPLEIGKIWTPSGPDELRDVILTDLRLQAIADGIPNPPVQQGTDSWRLATAVGNLGLMVHSNVRLAETNADVLVAEEPALDNIREAAGLPIVQPSPSTGKIYIGTANPAALVTLPDGTQFQLPNGKLGKVAGTHVAVPDGGAVDVITIDTGSKTELAAGEIVRFVAPPLGVEVEAEVSVEAPLRGGQDAETPARKRTRILNRRRTVPQGGNPGHLIELALNALATLQYAFVYPALGGPSSSKIILVKDFDEKRNDFTRALSVPATAIVRAAIHAKMPDGVEHVVQSVVEETTDVAIKVTIPNAASAGGNGLGWKDAVQWPPLSGGDTRVSITALPAGSYTVNASTAVSPVPNQTHIMWWSTADQKFYERLVLSFSGGAGAWNLGLDAALVDSHNNPPAIGDFISPAAVNMDSYGLAWRTSMRSLGPGENTTDSNRLPRSLRHPFIAEEWVSDLTVVQLLAIKAAHKEITDIDWSYRSISAPTVPASVSTAPNILKPRHFGVYRKV